MASSSLFAPFRSRDFRVLWAAVVSSNLGSLIQAVGAGWMMATITASDDMVALVQAANTLPIMLFSLLAGALADSFDRRRIMIVAQILMMATSALLTGLAMAGVVGPWGLLAFTFLIGCGTALHNPSWQASIGDIVPRDDIPAAVTLNSVAFNLTRSVGPAIGGLVVATLGAAAAFAFNTLSYIPLITTLALWRRRTAPSTLPREAFHHAVVAGLRYVALSPNLITVVSRSTVFGAGAVAMLALLPLVARDFVNGDAATYGVLLGSFGVGAIGGALLSPRLRERFANEWIARAAFLGSALGAGGIVFSSQTWQACLALLPAGACWVLALSLFNVTVQLSTPRWVVGRTLSIYQMMTFGGMAAGSWVWGLVADRHGAQEAFVCAAVVLVLGALLGVRFPLPALMALGLDPHNQFKEPVLGVDLRSRSGPIMVMVDYTIAPADVAAFLEAMAIRRRIRIRNGGRQWALLRDLEHPENWTETYHVSTWVEYVRLNMRATKADAEITERLLKLHRGSERPRVHRFIERQTVPLIDDLPLKGEPEVT